MELTGGDTRLWPGDWGCVPDIGDPGGGNWSVATKCAVASSVMSRLIASADNKSTLWTVVLVASSQEQT